MKITESELRRIVREEISDALYRRVTGRERKETPRKRKDRVFPGYDEMKKVSNLIMDDKAEKKPKEKSKRPGKFKDCKGRGQTAHGPDGRFSSKEDATSHSLYFSCPEYPFRVRKGMKSISDPKDAGRGKYKNKGKGRWRVKDNTLLWEEDGVDGSPPSDKEKGRDISISMSALRDIIRYELQRAYSVRAAKMKIQQQNKPKRRCPSRCNTHDLLRFVRAFELAKKGKSKENGK